MISETPSIPKKVTPSEERFIVALKQQLRIYAEEINKLEKRIEALENEE